MNTHKVSIVIPAYNEEETIGEIIKRVKAVNFGSTEIEIVAVNNGSRDGTKAILKNIPGIKVLNLSPNRGKGGAVKAGFEAATGDIVIIQDADLEYDPQDIPSVIAPILEGRAEVVLGFRTGPGREGRNNKSLYWLSWFGNHVITLTTNILYLRTAREYEGCYKAFTKKSLASVTVKTNDFDFDNELVCKLYKKGYRAVDVPIRYYPRSYSQGKKINWRHGVKILKTIVKYRFID